MLTGHEARSAECISSKSDCVSIKIYMNTFNKVEHTSADTNSSLIIVPEGSKEWSRMWKKLHQTYAPCYCSYMDNPDLEDCHQYLGTEKASNGNWYHLFSHRLRSVEYNIIFREIPSKQFLKSLH